ncbi:MAG: hypothetical protein HRT44_13620, partial [Bdellovibrionales bacterium]|nr:methylmalonyl-CoA mutase family protein [Bdellovibrionales bacterium]NQZ20277.1 hypothetical protein [Bdellovibrionales bacterium]
RTGGAQGFFSWPYDLLSQQLGPRVPRNTLLMLDEESFIGKVQYPASGSGLSDDLVNQLCQKAWTFFQEIEKKGGLLNVLQSGWLQSEIAREGDKEVELFDSRELKMIGVNEFALTKPISEEAPLVSAEDKVEISQWWIDYVSTEDVKRLSDVKKLKPYQLSDSFEKWQYKADLYRAKTGESLKVGVYCEDPKTMKTKLSSCRKIMGLAGLEVELYETGKGAQAVSLFISADPEGNLVTEALAEMKEKGCRYSIWFGDREQKQFDTNVGEKSSLMSVYENIFSQLGGL